MIHYFIGDLGHFFIITSFVTSLVAAFAYWKSKNSIGEKEQWASNARVAFYIHTLAVVGVFVALFTIIYNH